MDQAPERGDAIWIDFGAPIGHEQAGRRPAIVISPYKYNRTVGLAIMCPITTRSKGYPFEVAIPAGNDVTGVILTDQIKNMSWKARESELICRLPNEVVETVINRLGSLLT